MHIPLPEHCPMASMITTPTRILIDLGLADCGCQLIIAYRDAWNPYQRLYTYDSIDGDSAYVEVQTTPNDPWERQDGLLDMRVFEAWCMWAERQGVTDSCV